MTDKKPNIVPFGKYKGQLLDEVIINDPNYLEWLAAQDWFRSKYNAFYQIIINRGDANVETPEHNAMQVKFLDDDFCHKFLLAFHAVSDEEYMESLKDICKRNIAACDEEIAYLNERTYISDRVSTLRKYQIVREIFSRDMTQIKFYYRRDFEVRGVDVVLNVTIRSPVHEPNFDAMPHSMYASGRTRLDAVSEHYSFKIELKPIVGDDYPAVLRQMKANESDTLVVGTYTGTGATREQFVKTFEIAEKTVIFLDDIETDLA